jgi:hypothetical protein
MGVNFSFCDSNWSYGGFHEAREKLAKEIGIDLNAMEGFTEKNAVPVSWNTVNSDIKILLNRKAVELKKRLRIE